MPLQTAPRIHARKIRFDAVFVLGLDNIDAGIKGRLFNLQRAYRPRISAAHEWSNIRLISRCSKRPESP